MSIELPPLPYSREALEPHVSRETIDFHYGKHHQTYVNNLNRLVESDDRWAGMKLEAIVSNSSGGVFNNAAQVWNHTFYWQSMSPQGGGEPVGVLAELIARDFGSFDDFKAAFAAAAAGQFGSGWAWLVQKSDGSLAITTTTNAETPLTSDDTPLLTCDVWEHAYYVDRRNDRAAYVDAWWNLVNWEFAAANVTTTREREVESV